MLNSSSTKNAGFQNPSPLPEISKGKNYLFAIGIDKYAHLPQLFNAVKDAQEVVEILLEKYQFKKELVIELYDDQATRRIILKKLNELIDKVTPKDNVIIYFSGHGEYHKNSNEGYWIPVKAENGEESDYIPNSVIRKKLNAIKSHHTFLMVDSCFSGSLFAKGGKNVSRRYERDPSRWGLTAGRKEIVSDGKPGDNSPFAESLLYRLKNNTGSLSVQELCSHVVEHVEASTGSSQSPVGEPLQIEGHKNGQFVFHMKQGELGDWTNAIAKGTVEVYESFLVKYPTGQYLQLAKEKIDFLQKEKIWREIERMSSKEINTIRIKLDEVIKFIKKYPESGFINSANKLKENLEYELKKNEFLNWEEVIKDNAISAFQNYLVNYPDGRYSQIAKDKISFLQTQIIWSEIEQMSNQQDDILKKIKKVIAFIENHPKFLFINSAKELRRNLQYELKKNEFLNWEKAVSSNTILAYQTYINNYPTGQYTKLAKGRIKKIETKKIEQISSNENTTVEPKDTFSLMKLFFGSLFWDTKKGVKRLKKISSKNLIKLKLYFSLITLIVGVFCIFRFISGNEVYEPTVDNKPIAKRPIVDKSIIEKPDVEKPEIGYFTDPRDKQRYTTVQFKNGKIWMAENLNWNISKSYCYEKNESNCHKYGRLYTWEAAKNSCPLGWRLPSFKEWGNLGSYKYLINGGGSGFSALFGGYRKSDGEFDLLNENGYFWSANESGIDGAYRYVFDKSYGRFKYGIQNKDSAYSCRCIKD